jgi:rubrerythrin
MNQDPLDPTGILEIAPSEDYEPIEDDVELLDKLNEKFRKCHEHRAGYEREWELYRLYHKGEQYLYRDRDTGDVVRLAPKAQKRLFSQNNQMRPAARSLAGKLGRMIPTFSVIPATTDSDEVYGARVAEAFVEFFRRKEKLDGKYLDVIESMIDFGTGVLGLEWDPSAGRTLAWCSTCKYTGGEDEVGADCPICEAELAEAAALEEEAALLEGQVAQLEGQPPPPRGPNQAGNAPIPKLEKVKEGDLLIQHYDTRDVFVEPGVVKPEKLRYCFNRFTETPLSEIRERFPSRGMFVESDSAESTNTARYTLTKDGGAIDDSSGEYATLYRYVEVPSGLYPKGRVIWFTRDVVLEETESPYYKLGRLPLFFFRWILNPGEFWGEPPAAQAWHRQKELNALETVIREYEELMVRLKVLDPLGSQVSIDEFTPVTGQKVKYNPIRGKPEYLTPPEMPQGIFARRMELIEDIRVQYAISSTEFGMEQSDPNGRAMAIIEAESDQQVGPILRRIFMELSWLVQGALIVTRDRYSPERKFSVSGDDGFSETFQFDEMNLSPGFDLQLEPDDGLAKNQAVRITQAADLANIPGLLSDPMTGLVDAPRFAKMAKLKVPGIGTDLISTEYAAATELIRQMEQGLPPQMAPEDDPQVFAKVLLGWLRGRGRKADQMLREMVRMTWMQYSQLAMMQQMPQGPGGGQPGAMGAAPGGGAGGPDQSAPGGTPNNPGHLASDLSGGSVVSDAERNVASADQAAEQSARVQSQREG